MTNHAIIFSFCAEPLQRGTGAHRIASVLRQNEWDVEVLDFAPHLPLEHIKEFVKSRTTSSTIFFGFSVFFNYWDNKCSTLTAWLKKTYPDVKRVIGGQSVGLTKATNIDYWVDSYGEVTILELVKSFTGNSSSQIKYHQISLPDKHLIKSIQSYPAYPLASYSTFMEDRDFVKPYEWLMTEFSRGCKFQCSFCNYPILGVKGDYSRSAEDFKTEMKYNFDKFGVQNYYVADETFNDSTSKIIKFADAAESLSFRPFFSGFVRPDLLVSHTDSWEHYVRLNFGGQFYGVDTFNKETGKLVGKGINPDKLKQGLIDAKTYFNSNMIYKSTISMIVGLPCETRQSILESKNWLVNNWIDQNIMAYPLIIEDPDDPSIINNLTNLSKFSKSIKEYGFRRLKGDTTLWGNHGDYRYNWRNTGYSPKEFLWEHDTMNIFEARDLAEELQLISTQSGLNVWFLHLIMFKSKLNKLTDNISELRSSKLQDISSIVSQEMIQTFLTDYMLCKLNSKR